MVKAFQGWDTVCLDAEGEFCGHDTMFGNVVHTGLPGLNADGIIGLGPEGDPTMEGVMSEPFLPTLKKKGAIDHAVFSMFIQTGDAANAITLGGFDTDKYGAPGSELQWHDTTRPGMWMLDLTADPAFGEAKMHNTGIKRVLIDSGASMVIFPRVMR